VLGLWNLTGMLEQLRAQVRSPVHAHPHRHGDYVHNHAHGHGTHDHGHREDQTPQAWLDRTLGRLGLYQVLRPFVVGLVHGLAGSAAVALLVLATITDPRWAMAYLVLFGFGTIVGMILITTVIAAPLAYANGRLTRVERHLRLASGLLSVAFGLFLVYQIGFVHGLFTAQPISAPK
jgi:high-affinity nickel-transport protein